MNWFDLIDLIDLIPPLIDLTPPLIEYRYVLGSSFAVGLAVQRLVSTTQDKMLPGWVQKVGYVKSCACGWCCVASSTDHSMNIQARITLKVEFIRAGVCRCLLFVCMFEY
jgi:hypothetical protein